MTTNKVRYSPLLQQYEQPEEIFETIKEVVASGDFTLGKKVAEFEEQFANLIGVKHAIGVGSGTDSLKLPMRALDVGHGDEVITCANTFISSVGAIDELGARPNFIDCDDTFCMDLNLLEDAITPNTKAIMPVHLTGEMVNMPELMEIADKHNLPVVEDACQSLLSELGGQKAGTWGIASGFSMHPLKLINVWGDGGITVTNDDDMADNLRLLRNHGLRDRDTIERMGYNTRLDTIQAVVGSWILRQAPWIANSRCEKAVYYDNGLKTISQVRLPIRRPQIKHTYLLYIIFAEQRDELLQYCLENGIEAKIHYPVPLYQQPGLKKFGYEPGDFPVSDRHANEMLSFPVDQHLTQEEQDYIIKTVKEFYKG